MEPIYVVLIIILLIWSGIFGYMLYIDKEVKNLLKRVKKIEKEEIKEK
jgi:CcmD family protein